MARCPITQRVPESITWKAPINIPLYFIRLKFGHAGSGAELRGVLRYRSAQLGRGLHS